MKPRYQARCTKHSHLGRDTPLLSPCWHSTPSRVGATEAKASHLSDWRLNCYPALCMAFQPDLLSDGVDAATGVTPPMHGGIHHWKRPVRIATLRHQLQGRYITR